MNRAMGAAIRARRAILKMSVDEVAEAAGMSSRTMARYLKGDTTIDFGVLVVLADVLNTSVEQLVRDAITISRESGEQN